MKRGTDFVCRISLLWVHSRLSNPTFRVHVGIILLHSVTLPGVSGLFCAKAKGWERTLLYAQCMQPRFWCLFICRFVFGLRHPTILLNGEEPVAVKSPKSSFYHCPFCFDVTTERHSVKMKWNNKPLLLTISIPCLVTDKSGGIRSATRHKNKEDCV